MCVRERIPLGTLLKILLCFLEPTACHVGQNCFDYSTSSELTVLVTFRILPRVSCWLIGRDGLSCWRQYVSLPSPADVTPIIIYYIRIWIIIHTCICVWSNLVWVGILFLYNGYNVVYMLYRSSSVKYVAHSCSKRNCVCGNVYLYLHKRTTHQPKWASSIIKMEHKCQWQHNKMYYFTINTPHNTQIMHDILNSHFTLFSIIKRYFTFTCIL